ncbi:MAG: DUF305 domain-containing protein [Chloroflexi bacterium]|uniref:DUF305 domain-containing protein n=1 Tax=Candidatus Flexifilum breve TaxID=3140694 RepID=UPI00313574F2|nr:DUF305 domain-containing protein [Chloroflexota bacterium]
MKHTLTVTALLFAILTIVPSLVSADAPVEGRIGRAEVRYMEGMIDHHQMAIDMALDCLVRTDVSDSLTEVCQSVVDAQQPEIEQMQAWLLDWYNIDYAPVSMADMMGDEMGDMDHGGMNMAGMPATDPAVMMGMFAGFNRLEGADYEVAWFEAMVDHHDDAVHMSERLLERDADQTGHAELRALAQAIITAQTGEINSYEELIAAHENQ